MSQDVISQQETLQVLVGYVERASEAFLDKYNLKQYYQTVRQSAEQGLNKISLDYINALMNGTVDVIVAQNHKSNDIVHDDFVAFYAAGGF